MTSTQVIDMQVIEQVVLQGDLAKLTPAQRVSYYHKVCESVGLNPYTRPFDYIILNGKLTLYARKDCTEQLRKLHGISIEKLDWKIVDDLYIVTARARDKHGRTDESTGAVTIGHLKGDAKANAIMKAETKSKRRVTLSLAGLGWTDEAEVDTIPGAKKVAVDDSGQIIDPHVKQAHPELPSKLSVDQVKEIKDMLNLCEDDYKIWFFDYIQKVHKVDDIADLDAKVYEKMKATISKYVKKSEVA